MNKSLRALIPALMILAAAPSLKADTSIRFSGTVKTKDGQPIKDAKIVLQRLDIDWKAEFSTGADGTFARAGITPLTGPMYMVTVSKDGYVQQQEKIVLSLSNEAGHHKDFVLLTPSESPSGTPGASAAPGFKEDADARAEFNAAVPLYKDKKYAEALPNLEKAYKDMNAAVAAMTDELAKSESQSLLPIISKAYGLALHQVGRDDDALAPLAQTVDADPKNPQNADAMKALVDIYAKKKDTANRAKYQALLGSATGSSDAATPYSDAAKAFNAGRFKEAKQHLTKAIEADPSFPDSYYLMGLLELNQNNIAGAKTNFRKYMELAPNGKHAEEVKGALAGL